MSLDNSESELSPSHAPIGFLVLAAGHSRRFGRCKLSARFDIGKTSSGGVSSTVLGAVLDQITPLKVPACIVTSSDKASVVDIATQRRVQVCQMPDSSAGMGQSIAFGVSATTHWRGWIICLGDMPWITSEAYAKVLAQAIRGAQQVAPHFNGRRGHPVYFAQRYGKLLKKLSKDVGAASLIDPEVLVQVSIEDGGILEDVDGPEDLA